MSPDTLVLFLRSTLPRLSLPLSCQGQFALRRPRSALSMSSPPPRRRCRQHSSALPDSIDAASPKKLPGKWAVVAAASLVHALHATAVYMVPSTLLSPMRHALGLSIAEITRPLIAYRIVQAMLLLPAGILLDIIGPQLYLRVAITAAALSAPLLPLASSLSHLMTLQIFFALSKLIGGLSTMLVVVASAFPSDKGMGTATSVLLSGYSLAGFIAPAVIGTLSQHYGWRAASMLLSLVFAVFAVPLTFHFLREHPSSTRRPSILTLFKQLTTRFKFSTLLQSEKQQQTQQPSPPPPNAASISLAQTSQSQSTAATPPPKEPLLPAPYLPVAVAVFAFSFSMHIVFDHLLVFLSEDFGMPFDRATYFMSALNLISLCTKLAVGPLADRLNKSLLMAGFGSVGAVASMLLLDFSALTFQTTTSVHHVMSFILLCEFLFSLCNEFAHFSLLLNSPSLIDFPY